MAYMHAYIQTGKQTNKHTHTHIYVHAYIHKYIHTCTHTHTYAHMHTYIYVHIHTKNVKMYNMSESGCVCGLGPPMITKVMMCGAVSERLRKIGLRHSRGRRK